MEKRSGFTLIGLCGHLGGMTSGDLGATNIGDKKAIGGIAREFYRRLGQHYGVAEEWDFEPHVAEQVFNAMAQEAQAPVYYRQFLQSVKTEKTPEEADLGHTAILADYGRGLVEIALGEVFDGNGSVLVSGFGLIARSGLDPIADRLLRNLAGYTGTSAGHCPASHRHPHCVGRLRH